MDMQQTIAGIEAQTWLEMTVGLFCEGLLLGLIFYWLQERKQKQSEKNMQDHLKQEDQQMQRIENILREQHSQIINALLLLRTCNIESTHKEQMQRANTAEKRGE